MSPGHLAGSSVDALLATELRAMLLGGARFVVSLHAGGFRGSLERHGKSVTPEIESVRLDTLAHALSLAAREPEKGSDR